MVARVVCLVSLGIVLASCGNAAPPTAVIPATADALVSPPASAAPVSTTTPETAEVANTEVVRYVPETLPADSRPGDCWGPSIATYRNGAYRCKQENEILDPCFAVASDPNTVLCQPNPTTKNAGIRLALTAPLPDLSNAPEPGNSAWLVELPNGMTCTPFTGTLGQVNAKLITYHCAGRYDEEQTVLLGDLTAGERWTAEQAIILPGNPEPQLKSSAIVVLQRVWQ